MTWKDGKYCIRIGTAKKDAGDCVKKCVGYRHGGNDNCEKQGRNIVEEENRVSKNEDCNKVYMDTWAEASENTKQAS